MKVSPDLALAKFLRLPQLFPGFMHLRFHPLPMITPFTRLNLLPLTLEKRITVGYWRSSHRVRTPLAKALAPVSRFSTCYSLTRRPRSRVGNILSITGRKNKTCDSVSRSLSKCGHPALRSLHVTPKTGKLSPSVANYMRAPKRLGYNVDFARQFQLR